MTDRTELMRTVWSASDAHNEHNDCTVKALTIATGLPYEKCHSALSQAGRRRRCGTSLLNMISAGKALGFSVEQRKRRPMAKTMTTAERSNELAKGRLILATRSHVAAMIDGSIIDWTKGRKHRITAVFDVTPIPGHQPRVTEPVPFQPFKRYTKRDQLELFV